MTKPIIGIAGNERHYEYDAFIKLSYTPGGFIDAVKAVGGIPIILPIGTEEDVEQYISLVDKLIIAGGQNVDPSFYGEEKTIESDDYLYKRDIFELALIKEARKQQKPIFTVCRGTQLYNVALGGTLNQAVDNHWQGISGRYETQKIITKENTILHNLFGAEANVNSFHRQSIKDLADILEVIAYDPKDNIIEAVQTTDGSRYLGVQWHPELLYSQNDRDYALFDYVVNKL